jgi:peptidoglycan/LPS O-acetylase OafA/YrhL
MTRSLGATMAMAGDLATGSVAVQTSLATAASHLAARPPDVRVAGGRIRTLDGLRAVSIILVILGHLGNHPRIPARLSAIMDFANFGVRIFFVISGFLITNLLLKEQKKKSRISIKNFYLRRVFRIFPAFYAYFFIIVALSTAGYISLNRYDAIAAGTYLMNYRINPSWHLGHIWSLSVEEQFYFMWPWAIALAGWRWASRIAVAVFVSAPVFRIAIFYLQPTLRPGIGAIFPTIADALAIGCLLAIYRDWLWAGNWYRKLLESRWFLIVPLGALLANKLGGSVRLYILVVMTAMNLGVAATIDWSIRNADSWIGRILEYKAVAFIGVVSYSLYLWQQPFLDYRDGAAIGSVPTRLLFLSAAALASYHFIEMFPSA